MKLDVVGFGALNVDRLFQVERIARENEESFITGYTESLGGSAANTIVALARLKVTTGYIGKLAQDPEGTLLLQDLIHESVDVNGVIVSKQGKSGVVLGFVDSTGERAMYVNPGVNDTLSYAELDPQYCADARFLHLTSFVGLKPFEAQVQLVNEVPAVQLSLDPGSLYASKGRQALRPLLQQCRVFFPNESELKLLTGKDPFKGARHLLKTGVEIVAVKLGGKGCYVTDGKENHLIEPYQVQIVDTTGAGDAFCAGFLYGLLQEKDLYMCGKLGNYVASQKALRRGARAGLPRIDDVHALL